MVIIVEGSSQEGYEMSDTSELIAHANHEVDLHEANRSYMPGDMWELIADMVIALAAQAQEIEQAKRDAATERTLRLSLEEERNAAEVRMRELKDEIDRLQTVAARIRALVKS
jgi:hypothetical protein